MSKKVSKKEQRFLNKQKKLIALYNIVQINDAARREEINLGSRQASIENLNSHVDTECNLDCERKRNLSMNEESSEQTKKIKLHEFQEDIKMNNTNDLESHREIVTGVEDGPGQGSLLSPQDYAQIKKELNARAKWLLRGPKFRTKDVGDVSSLLVKSSQRVPIFLSDIQDLLLKVALWDCSQLGPTRWCYIEKPSYLSHAVVVVVEGLTMFHYVSNKSKFVHTKGLFSDMFEVIVPKRCDETILKHLALASIVDVSCEKLVKEHFSLSAAIETLRPCAPLLEGIFPVSGSQENNDNDTPAESDNFLRTQLLVPPSEMVDENYPVPLHGSLAHAYKHYVLTKPEYARVNSRSPLFGLDCEMCLNGNNEQELTRISIVNENMDCIYESLVKPKEKIVNYLTEYSGITKEVLEKADKDLEQVQTEVSNILPSDAILVGQSLNFDLHVMKMMHPYIIDTSIIYNFSGDKKRKTKLKYIAKHILHEDIQMKKDGHDSVEDSQTCLKLAKHKLSKHFSYSNAIYDQNSRIKRKKQSTNLLSTAIISSNEHSWSIQEYISSKTRKNNKIHCFATPDNTAAICKIEEVVTHNRTTLANLSITKDELEARNIENTISKVDGWIHRIYQSVPHNALFIVILGGNQTSSSGVAMIGIKKDKVMR